MSPPPLLSSLFLPSSLLFLLSFPLPLSPFLFSYSLNFLTQSGRMFETFGEEEEKHGVCLEQALISGLYPPNLSRHVVSVTVSLFAYFRVMNPIPIFRYVSAHIN